LLVPQGSDPTYGNAEGANGLPIDFTGVDMRLPMLVYVSREKRPGFEHNKKAGAMNALVRASAIMSNGPFILNFDCDHYVYNSQAFREAICFMMSNDGDKVAFIQFPQRFEGVDPSDRYNNRSTVFFDINMRALDGLQGPVYVGTGCMFRRIALYGFDPPRFKIRNCNNSLFKRNHDHQSHDCEDDDQPLRNSGLPGRSHWARKFGSSEYFLNSIDVAEYEGRPLADHISDRISGRNRREQGALRVDRRPISEANVEEAIYVISCPYEEKTGWGNNVGWVYGTITEDIVTGYKMHTRGWRSLYYITRRDAFRGTAPINLTDRLIQVIFCSNHLRIMLANN
jgi:cellulose synthase-like protein